MCCCDVFVSLPAQCVLCNLSLLYYFTTRSRTRPTSRRRLGRRNSSYPKLYIISDMSCCDAQGGVLSGVLSAMRKAQDFVHTRLFTCLCAAPGDLWKSRAAGREVSKQRRQRFLTWAAHALQPRHQRVLRDTLRNVRIYSKPYDDTTCVVKK